MKAGKGRSILLLVLLLVNAAAVWGQAGWALDHIVPTDWDWRAGLALSLGFALAIEMIGVFLALSADHAEDRDIPAGGIRLGSYAIGLVSGALNASHWGWTSAAAIAFALLSTISPFLWGIHSRVNRERTIAPSRRFWHPHRSVALIRHMAWEGIATEQEGILSMARQAVLSTAPTAAERERAEEILEEIAVPISPAPAMAAIAARKPRTAPAELEKAVRMLIDQQGAASAVPDAMAATGLSRATVALYAKAVRLLRADPATDIAPDGKLDGRSIKADMLSIIRDAANRERAL